MLFNIKVKLLLIFSFGFLFFSDLCGQEKKGSFADQLVIGSGISMFPNSGGFNNDLKHLELSWISNASLRITKVFHLGIEYRFIRTFGSTTSFFPPPPTTYNMYGLFSQVDILNYKDFRIFGQINYNQGNHCGCIKSKDPFKVDGLRYLGWGAGINYRVLKYISIDASLSYDYVLNPGDYNPYASGYWALGINYDLNRKRE